MKYYQVLPKFDGLQVWRWSDRARALVHDRELIAGELFTPAELNRFVSGEFYAGRAPVRDGVQLFRVLDIPKSKIYISFGVRFPIHELQEGGAENVCS
ncbi:MAG: hypothetical protein J6S14_11930 [Clostridia bacterium]|nr:hypothetical protein [Clostridia bacterium]